MSTPFGFISVADPILPTCAIMGDDPAEATRGADAWGEAVNYAVTNGLLGVYVPPGVLPVDAVCEMDGSKSLSVVGMGRLRSVIKKYGSSASSVSENDPNRPSNTRLGFNVGNPNAVLHVYNQWSDGEISNIGLLTDIISSSTFGLADPLVMAGAAGTDICLVVHGMSHAAVRNVYIAGGAKAGYLDLYPSIVSEIENVRIGYCTNGAGLWSHNQSQIRALYPSHFRYRGISVSLDGGVMECCPVELGGSSLSGHQPDDVAIAYGLYNCRSAELRHSIGEGNSGCLLELASNDGLRITGLRGLAHKSDYAGPLPRIFAVYGAGNNKTTIDVRVDYAAPALSGGASIAQHYDFGGSGNTNTTLVRNEYAAAWGSKSYGSL